MITMEGLPKLAPRPEGLEIQSPGKPTSKDHTEKDWNRHKALIQRLYIVENKKLNEIMSIMSFRHGFVATEQVYKKRLKKWGLRKRAYRKASLPSASTSPANSTDAQSSSYDEDDVEEVVADIEPSILEQTLAVSSQPSQLKPFAGLELVLNCVFSWSQAKLEMTNVELDTMSRYLANPNRPVIQDSRTMYRTFELVFDLFQRGEGKLAGMAARKGVHALEFVLTEDHPDLIWHVLDTIYDMVDRGHVQLLGLFIERAHFFGQKLLPAAHPLLLILQQLWKCDYQTEEGRRLVCHTLRQAWLKNVDMLSNQVGSLTPQHMWLYEQLIWDGRTHLRQESDLAKRRETMLEALEQMVQEHTQKHGSMNSKSLRLQALMLEFTQMDLRDSQRAQQLAADLLQRSGSSSATRSNARFVAYARKMLARIDESKQNWQSAEGNLRWAIAMRETAHGTTNDLRVIRDMWVLAAHFEKIGRPRDSAEVAQDAITRAGRYLQDVSC